MRKENVFQENDRTQHLYYGNFNPRDSVLTLMETPVNAALPLIKLIFI